VWLTRTLRDTTPPLRHPKPDRRHTVEKTQPSTSIKLSFEMPNIAKIGLQRQLTRGLSSSRVMRQAKATQGVTEKGSVYLEIVGQQPKNKAALLLGLCSTMQRFGKVAYFGPIAGLPYTHKGASNVDKNIVLLKSALGIDTDPKVRLKQNVLTCKRT